MICETGCERWGGRSPPHLSQPNWDCYKKLAIALTITSDRTGFPNTESSDNLSNDHSPALAIAFSHNISLVIGDEGLLANADVFGVKVRVLRLVED
jgi:hypothetical protein